MWAYAAVENRLKRRLPLSFVAANASTLIFGLQSNPQKQIFGMGCLVRTRVMSQNMV